MAVATPRLVNTGAVVSMTIALPPPNELAASMAGRVRTALLPAASVMLPPLRLSEPVAR